MRGYFAGLMRSSGMATGGWAPAKAYVEPNAAEREPDPDAMVTPAPSAHITSVPSPPPPAPAETDPIHTVPMTREPLPQATVIEAAESQPGVGRPTEAHSSFARTAAARPTAVPEKRTEETPKPLLGQELVRAAIRWVAAGTPHVPRVEPVELSHTRFVTEAREDEATVMTMPDDRRADPEPKQTSAMPSPASRPDAEPREPGTVPTLLGRPLQLAPALPPVLAATPPGRDEIVEISIGSIHVRVDAPVTPAVAHRRVTPPPPVAPRIPAATPSRSALSRRALRRI